MSRGTRPLPSGSPGRPLRAGIGPAAPRLPASRVLGREIDDVISADLHALLVPYVPLELGLEQLFQELAGEVRARPPPPRDPPSSPSLILLQFLPLGA